MENKKQPEAVEAAVIDLAVLLASAPNPANIRKNAHLRGDAAKTETIPISAVEGELDNIFGPMGWKANDLLLTLLAETVNKEGKKKYLFYMSLLLSVKSPETGEWISRPGASSGAASEFQIDTFAGKLKAEALKNAAKSLGARFGRDLNRGAVYQDTAMRDDKTALYRDVQFALEGCEKPSEVYEVQKIYRSLANEAWFQKLVLTTNSKIKKL